VASICRAVLASAATDTLHTARPGAPSWLAGAAAPAEMVSFEAKPTGWQGRPTITVPAEAPRASLGLSLLDSGVLDIVAHIGHWQTELRRRSVGRGRLVGHSLARPGLAQSQLASYALWLQ
jgi:hypothetical protein